MRRLLPLVVLALAACGSVPKAPVSTSSSNAAPSSSAVAGPNGGSAAKSATHLPNLPAAGSGRGGYYQDDGPGDKPPDGLMDVPDAIPKIEPYSSTGNKPYVVFGQTYTPITDSRPFVQRGVGSWYGKKFHGQKTSSGEPYDMYKLTAAHPTLPIPSYARVTNLSNGAQVIVRINDRGPFHSSRIIDLSYTAALKLGYLGSGSSELEVERLLPEEIERMAAARQANQASLPRVSSAVAPVASPDTASAAALTVPVPSPPAPSIVALPADMPLAASSNEPSGEAIGEVKNGEPVTGGYYLQLGVFADLGNAEAQRARLMQSWDMSLPLLEVTRIGFLYRVNSGPYANRADAVLAALKVQELCKIKPLLVPR